MISRAVTARATAPTSLDAAAKLPISSPRRHQRAALVVVAAKRARGPRDGGGGAPSTSAPKTGGGGGGGGGRGGGGGGGGGQSGFKSPGKVREGSSYEQETRKIILSMDKVTKSSPTGKKLLDGVGLGMYLGAKIGILGANGAGKSTLLRILAGVDDAFDGRLQVNDGIKVSYLEQEPPLADGPTVDDNIRPALARVEGLLKEFEAVSAQMAEPGADVDSLMAKMDRLQSDIDACNGWELERTLARATDALRCPPGDALVSKLSGGERRRVALARVLLESPDILLLDEPSTHLDALSMSWLERTLAEFRGTVVAVTHDRYFLDNVAGWILELDKGKGIPFEGNYSEWLEARALREQRDAKASAAVGRAIDKELEFARAKAKGQNKKGKARLRVYDELVEEQSAYARQATFDSLTIPVGPRLGGVVVEVAGLTKSVVVGAAADGSGGERRLLMEDVSFSVPPGAVVGIVGGNGVGKTTLFNMIMGIDKPDSGEIKVGETVKAMYVDQMRAGLDMDQTVAEAIASSLSSGSAAGTGTTVDPAGTISISGRDVPVRQYCSWFNFKGSDQQKKVGVLSGGERNRLNLARTLAGAGNLLLVDEPTNEADVFFVQALEAAIQRFAGSTMVISHDRWFLDRLATHILAFEGDSKVVWFEGGYSEYEADFKKRTGSLDPTRVKYRRMSACT